MTASKKTNNKSWVWSQESLPSCVFFIVAGLWCLVWALFNAVHIIRFASPIGAGNVLMCILFYGLVVIGAFMMIIRMMNGRISNPVTAIGGAFLMSGLAIHCTTFCNKLTTDGKVVMCFWLAVAIIGIVSVFVTSMRWFDRRTVAKENEQKYS